MMTSPPRCSYNSVMVETMFDYKFYIDKISEFMMNTFDMDDTNASVINGLKQENMALKARLNTIQGRNVEQAPIDPTLAMIARI